MVGCGEADPARCRDEPVWHWFEYLPVAVFPASPVEKRGDTMIRKTRLFTPGPTPLLPAAQFAMAAADIHHRTPEFRALFLKVLGQLKVFVGTQNDVLLLSSSGTGAMEASVSNLTSAGRPGAGADGGQVWRALGGSGEGLRLRGGCGGDALWADLRPGRGEGGAEAGAQGRLYAGLGDLDRGEPRCGRRWPRW